MLLYISQKKKIFLLFFLCVFPPQHSKYAEKAGHSVTWHRLYKFYDQLKSVTCVSSCLLATKRFFVSTKEKQ